MASTVAQAPVAQDSNHRQGRGKDLFAHLDEHSRAFGIGALVLMMAFAVVLLIWTLRGTVFSSDEWALMFNAQSGSAIDAIDPWNGHLLAVGRLIARASLSLAGSDYWFLITLNIAGIIACSGLVYIYARRRIGPILALAPAMVPLFFSGASTFYGAGIQFTPLMGINAIYPLVFGIGALLLLERKDRRGDIGACILLCLSLATFSYGIAFLAGAAVAIFLSPSRLRRAFVVAIPFLLYGAWWMWASRQGSAASSGASPENALLVPLYISDSLAAVGAGFFGLSLMVGKGPAVSFALQDHSLSSLSLPLFLATVEVVIILLIIRGLARSGRPWRASLWPPLTTLIVLWTLQGLVVDIVTRMPGDPRYLFAGAVLVALVLSEVARNVKFSRFVIALVLSMGLIGIVANLPRFREGKDLVTLDADVTRAAGTMFGLAGKHGDPTLTLAHELPAISKGMWIQASDYRQFTDRYGSLDMPLAELRSSAPRIRTAADRILLRSLRLGLAPITARVPGRCIHVSPGHALSLSSGARNIQSQSGAQLNIHRFGDAPIPFGEIPPDGGGQLSIPSDKVITQIPWTLSSSTGSFEACPT